MSIYYDIETADEAVSFDDVLIVPNFTDVASRKDVELRGSLPLLKLPIISSPMDTITGPKMLKVMDDAGAMGVLHRYMSVEDSVGGLMSADLTGPRCSAVGLLKTDKERIDALIGEVKENLWLCVDVAHGHSPETATTIDYIRKARKDIMIIAGNVATAEGAIYLAKAGADIIRCNVGSGAVCITRLKTGCGLPALTSLLLCQKAIRHQKLNAHIIADGGIRYYGDVCKAIAAGASGVMMGGMFAGTDGTPFWTEEGLEMEFRGMASRAAREAFGKPGNNAEGASKKVIAKAVGSTTEVLTEIEEGLRSAMSYVGARNIDEFRAKTRFVKISQVSVAENAPHFKG